MVLTPDMRQKIIHFRVTKKWSYRKIVQIIKDHHNTTISPSTAQNWTKKYNARGEDCIRDFNRRNQVQKKKVSDSHLEIINSKIKENPERSSVDLQKELISECGLHLSASYIRKLRIKLGWVAKRTKYGQMVRDVNKQKRKVWALKQIENNETFDDVIFSDEASIEAQRTTTKTYYKKGEKEPLRPKPKHPLKVGES